MRPEAIARLLPEVFRETDLPGTPLNATLAVVAAFLAPSESVLASLDRWFDPRRAPDEFVTMLADWLALGAYVDERMFETKSGRGRVAIDPGYLRELVDRGAEFARLRATSGTLVAMLEIATGVAAFRIVENPPDETGRPRPFHINIIAPVAARAFGAIVDLIVEREKPAFTTAEITYAER
jgi:phage tail-like protein